MAGKAKEKAPPRYAAQNRRARHDYAIGETVEAGIILTGSEVKGLRSGRASIGESYAADEAGELFLLNAHIPEYGPARENHEPRRPRKLLLHRRQMDRLVEAVQRKGVTLVPLSIYFNERGRAKVELGVAVGRKQHDKRAAIKERDWQREKSRVLRERSR